MLGRQILIRFLVWVRKKLSNQLDSFSGLVVVDKPANWTSHDVVAKLRGVFGTRKVGHAGTLDPLATGVLLVGVNKATRLLNYLVGVDKTYVAVIRLGQNTVTDDCAGELLDSFSVSHVSDEMILQASCQFLGDILQVPSSVSAIKVAGKRAYSRVFSGEEVVLSARPVHVSSFVVDEIRRDEHVDVVVSVVCSSGTYIRALARDLGASLGVGGHLVYLRRLQVGVYGVEVAKTLDQISAGCVVGGESFLDLSSVARSLFRVRDLSEAQVRAVSFGQFVESDVFGLVEGSCGQPYAGFSPEGEFVAVMKNEGELARPVSVFVGV